MTTAAEKTADKADANAAKVAPTPEDAALAEARDDADRANRRVALLEARAKATDDKERRAIARELVGLEADELTDLAADLLAAGTSLPQLLRKLANQTFGIVL